MLGRDPFGLLGHHAGGDEHRIARGDSAPRSEGTDAPREAARIAAGDLNVGDVDAQLVGDDLGPDRGVGLALAGDPGRGDHLARDQDLDVCALVGPDSSAFDVDREAHPDVIAGRSRSEHFHRPVEEGRIVAAVVDDLIAVLPRDAERVRKFVGLDEVAAADLDAVEAKLGGNRIEGAFHHEASVRTTGAAIWRGGRGVGVHIAEADAVAGHAVRPWDLRRRDDRQDDSVGRVRTCVMNEVVGESQDLAFTVEADLDLVHLAALVVDGGEVLAAVFSPLDRPAELHRGVRHQELVRVEEHDLRPKAAADVGRDDIHARFGQAEQHRQPAANRSRRLRRVVNRQPAFGLGPSRPDGARLHRTRRAALVAETKGLAMRCRSESSFCIANLLEHFRRYVARHVGVHEVLSSCGGFRCDHNRKLFVVHLDQLGGVLREGAGFGDHEGDRLAGIPHYRRGQALLSPAVREIRVRDQERQVDGAEREVGGGVDRGHTGQGACRAHVDRLDAGMGVRGAHETGLQSSFVDVVGEATLAPEQPVVFDSRDPGAEPPGCHLASPLSLTLSPEGERDVSSAARCTARRMDAYPVQRQRLPEIPSSICSGDGFGFSLRNPTTDITNPGVQKPHCRPWHS